MVGSRFFHRRQVSFRSSIVNPLILLQLQMER